jgi:hypothetical protein
MQFSQIQLVIKTVRDLVSSTEVLSTQLAADSPLSATLTNAFNQSCGPLTSAACRGRISFQQNASPSRANHLLLDFPSGHVLSSSEVHADAGEDEELPMQIIAVTYHHPKMGVIEGKAGMIEVTNTC